MTENKLSSLSTALTELRDALLSGTPNITLLSIADEGAIDNAADKLAEATQTLYASTGDPAWVLSDHPEHQNQVWAANTQVNFCAKAYPTVASGHPDAPVLSVLSAYLRNGFCIAQSESKAVPTAVVLATTPTWVPSDFSLTAILENIDTFADFDASIDWMLSSTADADALEQAILSVISSLDKPASPAGEVKKAFYDQLYGRSEEHRQAVRHGILTTTHDDLVRVTSTYLRPELATSALLTDATTASSETIGSLGWHYNDLT